MENSDIDLELLLHSNPQKNLDIVIPLIKEKVESYIQTYASNITDLDLEVLLTQADINQDWAIAHAYSILEYTKFFGRDDFQEAVTNNYGLLSKTQEFIFEFQDLNSLLLEKNLPAFYDPNTERVLCYQQGWRTHTSSQKAFVSAKMKSHYENAPSMGQEYDRKITPFIIRHAIELKVKNDLLGIWFVEKAGKVSRVPINTYIEFLKNNGNQFFDLPINIKVLSLANRWANDFVHTGIHEYLWLVFSVVERIEPLFSIQENGEMNLEGFNFRKASFDKNTLKAELESHLGNGYIVHLSEWEIEKTETYTST